jgi:D-serine deaminase-like pyridoxal phosphate-dependent protein
MAAVAAEAGVTLRPHAKTHKMPQVARMQLAAGSPGITVAKLGEAEVMAAAGIRDIFVAYPIVGEAKLARLCALAAENEIRVAADSWPVLEAMSRAAEARGLRLKVRLEVDSGFGRCGLQSDREVLALAERARTLPGIEIVGLMGFGGQSYEASGPEEIATVAEVEATQLVTMLAGLRALGAGDEVSVGSTPTSPYAARVPGVTEIRPGTYVFSDRTQVELGWGALDDCALTVLTTVVSRPTPGRAIVDVGTKGLTSDPAPSPGFGAVRGHTGVQIDALTEEHGILSVNGARLDIGARVEIIPNHACGALNMFDEVHVVRGGEVVDRWTVEARGRMQ